MSDKDFEDLASGAEQAFDRLEQGWNREEEPGEPVPSDPVPPLELETFSSILEPNADLPEPRRSSDDERGTPWLLDEEASEEDIAEDPDHPEQVQVRRLALALTKAVKATRLYPLDNPVCRKFARELVSAFDHTFSMMEEVRISVGKTKFFFRGEEVLDQPGREESVPGRFFWDGIREITFRQGMRNEEVAQFLGLCRRNAETAEDGEDDLVTLLWNAGFQHISYIAVDDILDLENPEDPVPEEFGTGFMNFVDLDMHDLEDEEESRDAIDEVAREIQARMKESEVNLFGVATEARDELLAELEVEDSPRILGDILTIISETLFLDRDETSFNATVEVLGNALESLIEEGRLVVAGGIVRILNDQIEQHPELTPGMRESLDTALLVGFESRSCDALVRHLNANLPDVLAAIDDFLNLLPDGATAAMCNILSVVESERARRKLVDALTRRAANHVDVFLAHLEDPRPEMKRDVIRILGGTGNDRALKPLKKLARHSDISLRCTAIEALCSLGPAKSGNVLVDALADPDLQVRMAAVKGLGEAGQAAVPPLYQIIQDRDFPAKDFSERKALFRAMGQAGGEDVVPLLESFLQQKSLFRRSQIEELKACACEGLGWAGGRRARALLDEHLESGSTLIRSAAQAAVKRLDSLVETPERRAA